MDMEMIVIELMDELGGSIYLVLMEIDLIGVIDYEYYFVFPVPVLTVLILFVLDSFTHLVDSALTEFVDDFVEVDVALTQVDSEAFVVSVVTVVDFDIDVVVPVADVVVESVDSVHIFVVVQAFVIVFLESVADILY